MQKNEIQGPPLQAVGIYTFPEKKRQVCARGWVLINLGALRRVSASLPSGREVCSLTEGRSFAAVLPSGSCYDFDYAKGREDWVVELPKQAIREGDRGHVQMSWVGMAVEVPAFIPLDTAQVERCRVLLTRMLEAFHNPEAAAQTALQLSFYALLDCLLHPDLPVTTDAPAEVLRKRIITDRRFETPLSELSASCGYTPDHLRRLFEARFGLSPKAYRTRYRMHLAQDLLVLRGLRVHEAAEYLGYRHAAHFSVAFKKYFGKSPGAWQDDHAKKQEV